MPGSAANIQGDLHVDRYLTNYSVSFIQDNRNFVAQAASSQMPVKNASDKYVVYPRGYFWRDEVEVRPLGGKPKEIGYKVESETYTAEEYALEHWIDDRQRSNTDEPIRLDQNAANLLSQKHMIKGERHWATTFFSASAGWTTNLSGVASSPVVGTSFLQWNDANSDPIGDVDYVKDLIHEQTGFMPNTMVLGADVKRQLRTHPDIADRIKYTQVGIADEDILSALFDIEKVVTARGIYNSAKEGDTDAFDYIVNQKGVWIGYIDRNPGLDSPTAIMTFNWTGLIAGTNILGGVIERGRDARAHSDYFQMRMAWGMKQVSADLGAFLANVVA